MRPDVSFLLTSLENFFAWQKDILDAMLVQHDAIQDYLPAIVQAYTVHDFEAVCILILLENLRRNY